MNNFDKYLTAEDVEHIKTINYLKEHHPDKIFFHIANEGKRTPFERYKASVLGKKKGLPDIAILHPKYELKTDKDGLKYNNLINIALFIELKAPERKRMIMKGKNAGKIIRVKQGIATEEQVAVIEALNKLKYKAVICIGFEEAKKVIDDYFLNI